MKLLIAETRDIATCQEIRHTVFTVEQGISREDDIDGLDEAATHLLALDDGREIGTVRFLENGTVGKIGRLAVLIEYRGQGVGKALVVAALQVLANRHHLTEARLGAQTSAIGFYEALGFTPEGEEFMDAGLPHREMVHPL
ncbi:MAG: GNAT family N-acetyltransferase [Boseongicola sp.]